MRKVLGAAGFLVLAAFVFSCGSDTPPPAAPTIIVVTVTPVPTPAPTAPPSMAPTNISGFWKVANSNGTNDWFNGFGIDIATHNASTGEIRGRSIYPFENTTGLLLGSVKSSGKIEWQTRYSNGTENGSMQWEPATGRMRGDVIYELSTGNYRYTNVLLARQP